MIQLISLDKVPDYYRGYIQLIPSGNYVELMETNLKELTRDFLAFSEKPTHSYGDGKWTVIQLLSHIIDVERVLVCRMHMFSRSEKGAIPGFDHDAYVENADLSNKTIEGLLKEFELIRLGTIHLMKSFSKEELDRKGTANNVEFTVNGLGWIILGHAIHHLSILTTHYVN